ncbi:MAG: Chromate resistance exported protein [Syntrophorhabdus sp. PtaU1.Bin153]|nr:MAG: Chromate resistance exported protein [Syntrophorhabdus sp. PtaU1.Bin153]
MNPSETQKWLLLIHQIPPKPNALRVKIWRRLQQVGAVAIKQSVYVMPLSEQSREDLSWTLKEIVEGGGDGSISEARFVEGLSDEQILALFHNARKSDYEKLLQEANALLAEWSSGETDPRDPATRGPAQLAKLQRWLDETAAIDFFQTPERATAELQLKELGNLLSRQPAVGSEVRGGLADLMGKTWVTRGNLFVDRIACGWLIRRFVDKTAAFKFVPDPHYSPKANEIRFDMFDGEYTHEGGRCTFEVMIQGLQIQDHALGPLSEVVHDIDLKDEKFGRSETDGFNALLTGLAAAHPDDDQRMNEGLRLFDNLYAYYQRQKRE